MLRDEYIADHPDGYSYSRYCFLYRTWEGRLPVTMRQTHVGGDRLFVDYAGDTVPMVVDRLTGEIRDAHLFVAVMGASSLSFAWPTWTETLPDWPTRMSGPLISSVTRPVFWRLTTPRAQRYPQVKT